MHVQSKNGWKRKIERVQCIYVCSRSDFLLINFGGHHSSTAPKIHSSTVRAQIDIADWSSLLWCAKKNTHTIKERKGHVCSAFRYVALILEATTLAQIEVDLDQSWQSSSSFVSTLYVISLHLYLYLYYTLKIKVPKVYALWCAKGVVFVNQDVSCHIQIKTRTAVWMVCIFATLRMFCRRS